VVDAATARIRASDADIGLFVCVPELADFYAASGWEPLERAELFLGLRGEAWREEEGWVMMGFFSREGPTRPAPLRGRAGLLRRRHLVGGARAQWLCR
jgi:hypothetical protein